MQAKYCENWEKSLTMSASSSNASYFRIVMLKNGFPLNCFFLFALFCHGIKYGKYKGQINVRFRVDIYPIWFTLRA